MLDKMVKKIEKHFHSHRLIECLAWFMVTAVLVAVLMWFLLYSGFTGSAEFVYEQF